MPRPKHISTTIDNSTWTAIVAPFDCNNANVINVNPSGTSVVLKLRSDSADANSEISINPGQQMPYTGPYSVAYGDDNVRFRFPNGSTVVFAQLASGSYSVKSEFW